MAKNRASAHSERRKAKLKDDLKRPKAKLGKKAPAPKTATSVEFRSAKIHLSRQSALEEKDDATNARGLSLKDLLTQTKHYNAKVRKGALLGIRDLAKRHVSVLSFHSTILLERTFELSLDSDASVRHAATLLIAFLFSELEETQVASLFDVLAAYVHGALSHISEGARQTGIQIVDLMVQHFSSLLVTRIPKILDSYVDMLVSCTVGFAANRKHIAAYVNDHVRNIVNSSRRETDTHDSRGGSLPATVLAIVKSLHGLVGILPFPPLYRRDGLQHSGQIWESVIADNRTFAKLVCGIDHFLANGTSLLLDTWLDCTPGELMLHLDQERIACLSQIAFILDTCFCWLHVARGYLPKYSVGSDAVTDAAVTTSELAPKPVNAPGSSGYSTPRPRDASPSCSALGPSEVCKNSIDALQVQQDAVSFLAAFAKFMMPFFPLLSAATAAPVPSSSIQSSKKSKKRKADLTAGNTSIPSGIPQATLAAIGAIDIHIASILSHVLLLVKRQAGISEQGEDEAAIMDGCLRRVCAYVCRLLSNSITFCDVEETLWCTSDDAANVEKGAAFAVTTGGRKWFGLSRAVSCTQLLLCCVRPSLPSLTQPTPAQPGASGVEWKNLWQALANATASLSPQSFALEESLNLFSAAIETNSPPSCMDTTRNLSFPGGIESCTEPWRLESSCADGNPGPGDGEWQASAPVASVYAAASAVPKLLWKLQGEQDAVARAALELLLAVAKSSELGECVLRHLSKTLPLLFYAEDLSSGEAIPGPFETLSPPNQRLLASLLYYIPDITPLLLERIQQSLTLGFVSAEVTCFLLSILHRRRHTLQLESYVRFLSAVADVGDAE
eukprot:Rmarinus@m.25702